MLAALTMFAAEGGDETRFILPEPAELLWGSIAFLLILIALMKFAFPKYKQTLADRTKAIQGRLAEAEKAKADADTMMAEYRQRLSNAQAEANRIIEEAKKTAEAMRKDLMARAEVEASEIVGRARAELGAEKERAMAELRASVASLSIRVAEKVIAKELSNEASQRAFVDQTIAELARMGNGRN
jgi:F-type H+-transporting ATPase subunit b